MVWEQHRLRVSVLRGEEGTRRHEGSGQDAQARGVRRGRAGMRRGHERVHRHERSGEDAQAREVRRGRVGTRRGQERTRGHEEGSGEDVRARGGVREGVRRHSVKRQPPAQCLDAPSPLSRPRAAAQPSIS